MKRVLIMGLPGAGKTTLAAALTAELFFLSRCVWINADTVREKYDDWDFSIEGRVRQAHRMRHESGILDAQFAIADFVCPLPEMREIFDADCVIWMDTISESKYTDTNTLFVAPDKYDFRITEQDAEKWAPIIAAHLTAN
jgi:adenylylsulfate kinase